MQQAVNLLNSLHNAALNIGRLDGAARCHPLYHGWRYRACLNAAVGLARAKGRLVDKARLAAALEGLRLAGDLDRHHDQGGLAQGMRGWSLLTEELPDELTPFAGDLRDRQAAESFFLGVTPRDDPALLRVARGLWEWIAGGGDRLVGCSAVCRVLATSGLTALPYPALTGAVAFCQDEPAQVYAQWAPVFLGTLAEEAAAAGTMLAALTFRWRTARDRLAPRRRDSRLPLVLDALATAGMLSPTPLAKGLGLSVRGATYLLQQLIDKGIAVEVSQRRRWRLFGLADLDEVRSEVRGAWVGDLNTPWKERPSPSVPSQDMNGVPADLEALFADLDRISRRALKRMASISEKGDGATAPSRLEQV